MAIKTGKNYSFFPVILYNYLLCSSASVTVVMSQTSDGP